MNLRGHTHNPIPQPPNGISDPETWRFRTPSLSTSFPFFLGLKGEGPRRTW